jgi:hypothetical protein
MAMNQNPTTAPDERNASQGKRGNCDLNCVVRYGRIQTERAEWSMSRMSGEAKTTTAEMMAVAQRNRDSRLVTIARSVRKNSETAIV